MARAPVMRIVEREWLVWRRLYGLAATKFKMDA